MARAFVLSTGFPQEELFETLKSYGVKGSKYTIHQTVENQGICKKLGQSLSLRISEALMQYFNDARLAEMISITQQRDLLVFIDEPTVVQRILSHFLHAPEASFSGYSNYTLHYRDGLWTCTDLGTDIFNYNGEEDLEHEEIEIETKFLKIANNESLKSLRSHSDSSAKFFENVNFNVQLAELEIPVIASKLEKIRSILDSNRCNRGKNHRADEVVFSCQSIRSEIEECRKRMDELLSALGPKESAADFSNIKLPLVDYNDFMVELKEEQSDDHGSHNFTVTNLTDNKLTDLALYVSENNECCKVFSLEPRQSYDFQEDYQMEALRYKGVVSFQIFFGIFGVSQALTIYSISITDVRPMDKDNTKLSITYHSHISAIIVSIKGNEVTLLKEQKLKNFAKSSYAVDIKDYKGPLKIYFVNKTTRISNEWEIFIN